MFEQPMSTPKIAVVIPFFQRKAGILARSLVSIAAQNYPSSALYVIVVDDGSPVPAASELQQFPAPHGLRITVIQQENAGPNQARNTALQNLEPDTALVAYLASEEAAFVTGAMDRGPFAPCRSCSFAWPYRLFRQSFPSGRYRR